MKSGFTQDTETSLGILLWLKESDTVGEGFLSLSLSLFPPFQSLFTPFYSIHKLDFRVLIEHWAEFWKVSSSTPHPDEYLEAHS